MEIVYKGHIESDFSGFNDNNIYKLDDGSFWVQTECNCDCMCECYPEASILEEYGTYYLFVCGKKVEVKRLDVVTESYIDGDFNGFDEDFIYKLDDGSFWLQTEYHYDYTYSYHPQAVVYELDGSYYLSACGKKAKVERLYVITESEIEGDFEGFKENRVFKLKDDSFWHQIEDKDDDMNENNPDAVILESSDYYYLFVCGKAVKVEQMERSSNSASYSVSHSYVPNYSPEYKSHYATTSPVSEQGSGGGFFGITYADYKEYKEKIAADNSKKESIFKRFTDTVIDAIRAIVLVAVLIVFLGGMGFCAYKMAGWLREPDNPEDHPGEVKLEYAASYYKGKNYYDTILMLREQGLSNISIVPLNDLKTGILSKDGKIETIEIDGVSDFNSDTWVSEDSVVNITYHSIIKKEKNGFVEEKNSHLIFGGLDIQLPNYLVEDSVDPTRVTYHVKDDNNTQLTILIDNNAICQEISEFDSYYLLQREDCTSTSLKGVEMLFLGKRNDTVFYIRIVTFETKTKSEFLHLVLTTPDNSKKDYDSDYYAILSGIYVPGDTEIRIDFNPKDYKGMNYEDVIADLKNKGFENIQLNNLQDVVLGLFTKDGVVESITINGRSDYKIGDWFDKNTEIVITYHGK